MVNKNGFKIEHTIGHVNNTGLNEMFVKQNNYNALGKVSFFSYSDRSFMDGEYTVAVFKVKRKITQPAN